MKKFLSNAIPASKGERKSLLITIGLCVLAAFAFVFLFSWSTSPIYTNYFAYGGAYDNGDSMQFQTVGKNWLDGIIPYRDSFDHKGPIIFLANALGFLIGGGSRYGIMVIQTICLAVSLYYIIKICKLVSKNMVWNYLTALASLIIYTFSYAHGNSVQEYNLPFIVISIYMIAKYFNLRQSGIREHNPRYALFYGIAIGICFLTQLTNAIVICSGVLVMGITLIAEKKYKNFFTNCLYGIIGLVATIAPFAIYFAINGCLYDFIYSSLIYNFEYASNIGSWLKGASGWDVNYFILTFSSFLLVFPASALAFKRKQKAYGAMLLVTGLLEAYLFLSAQNYPQYATLSLVQIPLFLNEVYLLDEKHSGKKLVKSIVAIVLVILCYNQTLSQISLVFDKRKAVKHAEPIGYEEIVEPELENIKKTSFTAFGGNQFKGIYLRYDLNTHNKYFVIQPWHASFSQTVREDIIENFNTVHSQYLLVDDVQNAESGIIGNVISEKYELVSKNDKFGLYKLK